MNIKSLKFFGLADAVKNMSVDRSSGVGAVALDSRNNVLCVGYNGFPRGVKDLEHRHERPTKYLFTSHAEENLVAQAAYTGVSLNGSTVLVTTLFPCTTCTRLMIQSGVRTIIYHKTKVEEKWEKEALSSKEMLKEAGVEVIQYDPSTGEWLEELKC